LYLLEILLDLYRFPTLQRSQCEQRYRITELPSDGAADRGRPIRAVTLSLVAQWLRCERRGLCGPGMLGWTGLDRVWTDVVHEKPLIYKAWTGWTAWTGFFGKLYIEISNQGAYIFSYTIF
jgi:hypothetical protein